MRGEKRNQKTLQTLESFSFQIKLLKGAYFVDLSRYHCCGVAKVKFQPTYFNFTARNRLIS